MTMRGTQRLSAKQIVAVHAALHNCLEAIPGADRLFRYVEPWDDEAVAKEVLADYPGNAPQVIGSYRLKLFGRISGRMPAGPGASELSARIGHLESRSDGFEAALRELLDRAGMAPENYLAATTNTQEEPV
jgi:hypothetical protein